MRPIEFRGKDIDNGEWVYGVPIFGEDYQGEKGKTFICDGTISPYKTIYEVGDNASIVDPETIGQFTGLYDKNGKKIFEGDIVRNYDDVVCVAGFHYFDADVEDLHNETLIVCGKRGNELFWLKGKFEVIGNIYDNPELLER